MALHRDIVEDSIGTRHEKTGDHQVRFAIQTVPVLSIFAIQDLFDGQS